MANIKVNEEHSHRTESLGGLERQERIETCREKQGVKEGRISNIKHGGLVNDDRSANTTGRISH